MTAAHKLLEAKITKGTLQLIDEKGVQTTFGKGPPVATMRLRHRGALNTILRNPWLNLGETYLDEHWDTDKDELATLLNVLHQNFTRSTDARNPFSLFSTLLRSWNTVRACIQNASHHYDLDEYLFRNILDSKMNYSCGYFRDPDDTLEGAQQAKSQHICEKLRLSSGDCVLDIGCGWGSFAIFLAENADVDVTGITLSKSQIEAGTKEISKRGLQDRVHLLFNDYRAHQGQYDAIVSIGMFEHVGPRFFHGFFQRIADMLKPRGVALLHTIGYHGPPEPTNPWIRRHIFPGGYIPSLSEISKACESTALIISDVEVWRRHYAWTLREWARRFQAVRNEFVALKGERFCRMWEFYLSACESAFEISNLVVYQIQMALENDTIPLTRDYLYQK